MLQAVLQVFHGGALAVQTISTSAPHVKMVQSVAIVALNVGYSFTGGSFGLGLDLPVHGLGFFNTPIPIQVNAIGERFEENSGSTVVGRQSGQSVCKTIRFANAVAGFFNLYMYTESITSSLHSESVQNPKTVRFPYNEELAIALESLQSIIAVSEARSPSGLEHGFTWTVTFFSAYTTADGSVELLKSNSSDLAGFAAITTPAMVIPPEKSNSEVVSAYIRSTQPSNQLFSPSINVQTISWGRSQPRIFKMHLQATHFDEAILITMSKST